MLRSLKNLLLAEDGQDLVEYALLAGLIAIASVAALGSLGPVIAGFYASIETHLV
jgi:Flp pilus assembly pilin Flp